MLTILREFVTYSDDGEKVVLCECWVEVDTENMRDGGSAYRAHYFRTKRWMRARLVEPGVYKLENGKILHKPSN